MRARDPKDGADKLITGESGDGWVMAEDGARYWGLFGAAGLVAVDPVRGVLLQHRVEWSHHGGTWGIPGGARHQLESARDAALREAAEEASVPANHVHIISEYVVDLTIWSYTTVIAFVTQSFDAVVTDAESNELRWVPVAEVETYDLHPGFSKSWPEIRAQIEAALTQQGDPV